MANSAADLRGELATEDGDDRIYEEIEAPKFVDFSAPEKSRPEDSFWFCTRIGCNQQHEEIDPEALHKSFVLRVLAARSPNIRFQKALSMHAQSRIPRCPRTAPAKSAKDGVQKLSTVSLIPQKIKVHPISSLRSTPVAEINKQNVVSSKTLTTPIAEKKCPSGAEAGRSVQNKKLQEPISVKKPEVKVRGAFGTVKKRQNAASANCQTPVSEMCSRMNKLQISSSKTKNATSTGHLPSIKKESAARATGLVPTKSVQINKEASTKEEQNDQQVMDIDKQSSEEFILRNPLSEIQGNELKEDAHPNEATNSKNRMMADDNDLRSSHGLAKEEEEVRDSSRISDKESLYILGEKTILAKELVPNPCDLESCEVHEATGNIIDYDSLVFDDNKENAPGNHDEDANSREKMDHENQQYPQKSTEEAPPVKTLKVIATLGKMQKKMKATNPKPFRFRTDERGILREENLEKRFLLHQAVKETIPAQAKSERSLGGGPSTIKPQRRKHIESVIDSGSSKPKKMTKLAAAPLTPNENKLSNVVITKTQITIKGSNCAREDKAKTPSKVPTNAANKRTASPWTRKPSTVPRKPNFHRIHLPKCCTKRLENILV